MWNLKPYRWTFILLHQNPFVYFELSIDLLLMHDFVTIYNGHLENIGSLNNADLPNADIFHYSISINITTNLTKEVWEGFKFTMADMSFSRILIFAREHKYYWQKLLSVVFSEMVTLLHCFSKKCLPSVQVSVTIACWPIVHSSINDVTWKQWLIQLSSQTAAQLLCLETNITLSYVLMGLYVLFILFLW